MTGDEQPGCDLLLAEAELGGHPLGELGVGLVEDGVLVIGGGGAGGFHQGLRGLGDVLEVSRLAGEALPVLGVALVLAPPEIGRVGDVGIGAIDHRQGFLRRTDA